MTSSAKVSPNEPFNPNDLFEEKIRQALNHFSDAVWLGKQSALASAYFLGDRLAGQPNTVEIRGKTLQTLLFDAAIGDLDKNLLQSRERLLEFVNQERAEMGNKGPAYHLLLLDLKYFRQIYPSRTFPTAKREVDIREFLGVGRGPFFNHLKQARQRLIESLFNQSQQIVRLEQPPQTAGDLIDKDNHVDVALSLLQDNVTLYICGPGGCGKTSLASDIANKWRDGPVFWFTFWPNLNDQLDSVLFSIAAFLNQQGSSNLWRFLVANKGHTEDPNVALTHLRTDLSAVQSRPLLCFDEVDHLLRDPETRRDSSSRLITFLERLKGISAIIFIGQQTGLQADHFLTLNGLSIDESKELIQASSVDLAVEGQNELIEMTGQNPRLIKLCLAILEQNQGDLTQLPNAASIRGLFASLWLTMATHEQQLAQRLAVFRSPAPADAWSDYQNGLQLLHSHALLQVDQLGGVRLLPFFRELILSESRMMSADEIERSHLVAAAMRAERAEYTAAVYHLLAAGEPDQAVQLWTANRKQEIFRGQGSIAYELLKNIPSRRLPKEVQEALSICLGELSELLGKHRDGLAILEELNWSEPNQRAIDAKALKGKFLLAIGERNDANLEFEEGLDQIQKLLLEKVRIHTWRGMISVQDRSMDDALTSARQAQYEAELFYGTVQEQQGGYDEAFLAYQRALALAKNVGQPEGIAKSNRGLASLLVRRGQVDEALQYANSAIDHFNQLGDLFNVEKMRNIVIAIYFNRGEFERVVSMGESSFEFFEQAQMPYWSSVTAATLSEAYLEIGKLEMAEEKAFKVISLEERQSVPYALYTLGLVSYRQELFENAINYLLESQSLAVESEDLYLQAYTERALGEVKSAQQESTEAMEHLQASLKRFKQLGNSAEVAKTESLIDQLRPKSA